jgi:hypothetical protein
VALTDILVLSVVFVGTAGAAALLWRQSIRGRALFAGVWLSFYGLVLAASMCAHSAEILYRVTAGRARSPDNAPVYNFRLYSLLLLGALLIWAGVVCLRAAPDVSRGSAEARGTAIQTSLVVALIVAPLIPFQRIFGILFTVLSLASVLIVVLASPTPRSLSR